MSPANAEPAVVSTTVSARPAAADGAALSPGAMLSAALGTTMLGSLSVGLADGWHAARGYDDQPAEQQCSIGSRWFYSLIGGRVVSGGVGYPSDPPGTSAKSGPPCLSPAGELRHLAGEASTRLVFA